MIRIAAQHSPFLKLSVIGRSTAHVVTRAAVLAAFVTLMTVAALATLVASPAFGAPPRGGAANLAMIGEPQTLDPMASTADLVGTIMQHVYELLYTYDANSNVVPMLAESMPVVANNGLV